MLKTLIAIFALLKSHINRFIMRIFVLTALFLLSLTAAALPQNNQVDRLTVSGFYFGKNLVVINPLLDGRFVVESVEVNGTKTSDEINSSVFEIDFSALGLKHGDNVSVNIHYIVGAGEPVVYNPEALEASSNFAFTGSFLEKKTDMLVWTISGSAGSESFEVEQYRWEKWIRVATVNPKDSTSLNSYRAKIVPHFGKNLFRVKLVDPKGNIAKTPSVKIQSKTPEVMLVKTTIETQLEFSGETMFQVYDEKGVKWLSGTAKDVDVTTLAPGKYWVNYDNKTELVKKK